MSDKMKLILENINFNGDLSIVDRIERPQVSISQLSYEFEFGKVYHLASERHWEMWALSLLVAGAIVEQSGVVKFNDNICSVCQRQEISWRVGYTHIKRFGLFWQNIKSQILSGIRRGNRYHLSEADYILNFKLTPSRYLRYITQVSSEVWRASCAIGLAHDKQIFCFPPMQLHRDFIKEYGKLWLFDMLTFMKSLNCLILLPLPIDMDTSGFCDGIVKV
mgnify:CR=1 FL=1